MHQFSRKAHSMFRGFASAKPRRLFAVLCLAVTLPLQFPLTVLSNPATTGNKVNLGSTTANLQANVPVSASHPATINVGGTKMNVTSATMLTPAESVALNQVLSTGKQYLQINGQGAAVGGGFMVNNIAGCRRERDGRKTGSQAGDAGPDILRSSFLVWRPLSRTHVFRWLHVRSRKAYRGSPQLAFRHKDPCEKSPDWRHLRG